MHIKKFNILVITAFFLAIFSGCNSPKELVYKNFNNLKIEKLGVSSSTISLNLVYYNPNSFGLQLRNTDLDVYINDNFLGHTTQEYQINIPKRSDFSVPIKMDVDMKNAYKNGLPALFGKEVMVKVVGKVKVGKANIFKTVNVNFSALEKFSM